VEVIEEEVTMVTAVWVEVCTEVETIEVATEAKVCNEVGEPVMLVETLEDQQATSSNVLSLSKVSLHIYILYLLKSKIFFIFQQLLNTGRGECYSLNEVERTPLYLGGPWSKSQSGDHLF
jgi:hypothetical protein